MSDSVRAEWRLAVDKEAPGTARGLVRQAVGLELPAERVDALLLLVTEVITNAVLHGSPEPDGKIGLRLERDGRTVRIVAIDGGHHFSPELAEPGEEQPQFGLYLVDSLADRWGVSVDGEKAVWFEVDS
jgi:anti-sigma regulatory factor (Ser/Thr protein kinase)